MAYSSDLPFFAAWGTGYQLGPGTIHVAHTDWEHITKRNWSMAATVRTTRPHTPRRTCPHDHHEVRRDLGRRRSSDPPGGWRRDSPDDASRPSSWCPRWRRSLMPCSSSRQSRLLARPTGWMRACRLSSVATSSLLVNWASCRRIDLELARQFARVRDLLAQRLGRRFSAAERDSLLAIGELLSSAPRDCRAGAPRGCRRNGSMPGW